LLAEIIVTLRHNPSINIYHCMELGDSSHKNTRLNFNVEIAADRGKNPRLAMTRMIIIYETD
jgi:hypothetical protein